MAATVSYLQQETSQTDRQTERGGQAGAERDVQLYLVKGNKSEEQKHKDALTIPSVQPTPFFINDDMMKQLFSASLTVSQWDSISIAQTGHSPHSICNNVLSIDLTAAARTPLPPPLRAQLGCKSDPAPSDTLLVHLLTPVEDRE